MKSGKRSDKAALAKLLSSRANVLIGDSSDCYKGSGFADSANWATPPPFSPRCQPAAPKREVLNKPWASLWF